jgi:DNA-binding transcriptional LysR family regulator
MVSIVTIDHIDLAGIDLNLLVALDALLAERNVTRAARKIGIGQSAMSSSLARLRHLFRDELLTRAPDGMQPTPRALTLGPQIRATLQQIQGLLRYDAAFEPATLERLFTLAMPDGVEVLLMPRILAYLRAEAPGVSLLLQPFDRLHIANDLDADRLDLGIGFRFTGQVHHKQKLLYRDHFLCLFNADLLGIKAPIALEDYLRLPHVLTSLSGPVRGVVDYALEKQGLARRVIVWTPRFLAVPFLVQRAPVLTTMSARLAGLFVDSLGLTASPPPIELEDEPISMIWHASYDEEPAHRWLRGLILRACKEPDTGASGPNT